MSTLILGAIVILSEITYYVIICNFIYKFIVYKLIYNRLDTNLRCDLCLQSVGKLKEMHCTYCDKR